MGNFLAALVSSLFATMLLLIRFSARDHPYITSAKGLGGFRKCQFLLMVSTAHIYVDIIGGW